MISAFNIAFINQYPSAFNELIRLGVLGAQNKANGLSSEEQDVELGKIFTVLESLDCSDLSSKETELLEYCLLKLNESTFTPTIEKVVSVSYTPELVHRTMQAWAGIYSMRGQDVMLSKSGFILAADAGVFSLSGQAISMIYNRALTAERGLFSMSGQAATLTYTQIDPVLYKGSLFEAVGPPCSWRCDFSDGVTTRTINLTNSGAVGNNSLKTSNDVTCTVYKTTNSGVTEDAGNVQFLRNGSSESVQTFSFGDNLNGSGGNSKQYIFTGVSPNDLLEAIITEG